MIKRKCQIVFAFCGLIVSQKKSLCSSNQDKNDNKISFWKNRVFSPSLPPNEGLTNGHLIEFMPLTKPIQKKKKENNV